MSVPVHVHQCSKCPRQFRDLHSLGIHLLSTHSNDLVPIVDGPSSSSGLVRSIQCTRCNTHLDGIDAYVLHHQTMHMVKCDLCGGEMEADEASTEIAPEDDSIRSCANCSDSLLKAFALAASSPPSIVSQQTGAGDTSTTAAVSSATSDPPAYTCGQCGKSFSRLSSLKRHQHELHDDNGHRRYGCSICKKLYTRKDDFLGHKCRGAPAPLVSRGSRKRNSSTVPTTAPEAKKSLRARQFHCRYRQCQENFDTRRELQRHRLETHIDPGHRLNSWPQPLPWVSNGRVDEALRTIYMENRNFINSGHIYGNLHSVYNYPLPLVAWHRELRRVIGLVEESIHEAVKLNVSLGYVLQNIETQERRYFAPGGNFPLLRQPFRIDRPPDWERFITNLDAEDALERLKRDRPDTKWELVAITNARIDVWFMGVNMGADSVPDYLKYIHCVHVLDRDTRGRMYDDTFCAFRALAYMRNRNANRSGYFRLEQQTRVIQHIWGRTNLALEDVEEFERQFNLSIDIYTMETDGVVYPRCISRQPRGGGGGSGSDNAKVEHHVWNLYKEHLSPVVDVGTYLSKFKCVGCERHFSSFTLHKKHRGRCARSVRYQFVEQYYKNPPTIFERLDEVGIPTPLERRYYPWFAVFDCESMLTPCHEKSKETTWTQRHEVVSMSISSNVPGYEEAQCFVDVNASKMVDAAIAYLYDISTAAYELAQERWNDIVQELKKMKNRLANVDDSFEVEQNDDKDKVSASFDAYCRCLPVLGFNSSNYDLNVLKRYIFRALNFGMRTNKEEDRPYIIKKNNSYVAVGTKDFRFLDICNYLASGYSYAQFLRAFDAEEEKGFFPYDWFDSVEKLDVETLPPYEAFYSQMKGANVLEEGTNDVAIGHRRYAQLQSEWTSRGMKTFRDYLVYYNNLDVIGFVKAVERMQKFYFEKEIDLFSVAVSAPGIARRFLYRTAAEQGVHFSPIYPCDEDLYFTFKKNIVGGPSLVMTREHEVGRTAIRGDMSIVCGNILGLDSNALYLWALDQFQPCYDYVRRVGAGLKPEFRGRHRDMFHWMDWVSQNDRVTVWHARNHGEVKIGKYYVDGFIPNTKIVLEFDGCFYHGCEDCGLEQIDRQIERREKTRQRREWLEAQGYTVIVMKEHTWKARMHTHKQLREFVNARLPPFYRNNRGSVTETDVLTAVRKGPEDFYGMVEVDIHVPDNLEDKFSEMCPLFTNTDVSFNDFGPYMQQYCRDNGIRQKTRRLLVAGLRAKKILLSSDLLKWYLDEGLVVTKVYQIIEYRPVRCFRSFVTLVSEARRAGDMNPDMKIIADTMKLLGNSGYGSLIMDKEKFTNTKYYNTYWDAQKVINSPKFVNLQELDDDFFETTTRKSTVRLDLPVHIGFHILQHAKLRMLQFYYNCLSERFDTSRFEMIQMDTDSNYFAIGGKRTERPVKELIDIAKNPDVLQNELVNNCCSDTVPHTPDTGHFFPRACCEKHKKFDSRTPGLFKLEASGVHMIGLCSKTYSLKKHDNTTKVSTKGLSKRALENAHLVMSEVLKTGNTASGINTSMRVHKNTVYSYTQARAAISSFYCKRVVQSDGIHTKPLQTILTPWPEMDIDVVENDEHPLWPDNYREIRVMGKVFSCLSAVCEFASKRQDVEAIVLEALRQFPNYIPKGMLVFVREGSFFHRASTHPYKWTTGLRARTARLVLPTQYPGLNLLSELCHEIFNI